MNHLRHAAAAAPSSRSAHGFRPPFRRATALSLLALLVGACGSAHAGDCTINVSPLIFGSYDPVTRTTPLDVNGNVQVDCDPTDFGEVFTGVPVSIALSTGSSGSHASRTMRRAPASVLAYNLYTSAARSTVWGDGNGGTQRVGGTVGGLFGQPNPRSFPVFGRIPPGQDPAVGLHSDIIIVTVTF